MQAKRWLLAATTALFAAGVGAQTVLDSAELYAGEKALYEAAKKEGMVVSFDTGPTWANWAAQFAAFKKRYPEVEIVYNDLGSGATVVALEKAKNEKVVEKPLEARVAPTPTPRPQVSQSACRDTAVHMLRSSNESDAVFLKMIVSISFRNGSKIAG